MGGRVSTWGADTIMYTRAYGAWCVDKLVVCRYLWCADTLVRGAYSRCADTLVVRIRGVRIHCPICARDATHQSTKHLFSQFTINIETINITNVNSEL